MKKITALLLSFVMALVSVATCSFVTVFAEETTHVYMIVTNPGEDCTTSMNVGFHSDWDYTECFVEYTLKTDEEFKNAKTATAEYNDEAYTWFYGHATTNAGANPFDLKFHDWDVTLKELTPDTEYIYRVCDGKEGYSGVYNFKTAGAEEFSILWMSDAHVNSAYSVRLKDWVEMVDYAETQAKYPIGFQFSTGDTVAIGDRYYDWLSIANVDFTKQYMIANIVGNHDVYDSSMKNDPSYTHYYNSSEYFKYIYANPKNAYTQTSGRLTAYLQQDSIEDPDGTKALEDVNGKSYWFLYNRVLFIMFDYWAFNYNTAEVNNAFNWASKVIADNEGKYDYLVASDHLNLINGGGGASRYYEQKYLSFLDSNNVDIFLAGDNHVYLRTDRLYNKQVTDDPTKGTFIIQAPCISRPQNFTAKDAAGYATKQYSIAGSTLGGLVIDVNNEGMTFSCLVKEDGEYSVYDTYTVPKKVRYTKVAEGKYKTNKDLALKAYASSDLPTLATVPAGTEFDITESTNGWGKVYYGGFTGWLSTVDVVYLGESVDPAKGAEFQVDAMNQRYAVAHRIQVYTPEFGATIASATWSFAYHTTITAVKDATGAYKVIAMNDTSGEPKKDTAIPENGAVILFASEYTQKYDLVTELPIGNYFTLDMVLNRINIANPPEPVEPQYKEIALKTGEITDGLVKGITAGTDAAAAKALFTNELTLTDASGNEVTSGTVCTGYIITNGKDSVTLVVTGDVTGDGEVDSIDAASILKYDAGSAELGKANSAAGDVTGDGDTDSIDASTILRYDAGIITSF